MDKQRWVAFFENAVPAGARKAVPVPVKEFILGVLATAPGAPDVHELEREHLPRPEYEALWHETFGSREPQARGYFEIHRERFYELFNALAHYHPRRVQAIEVLEVGVSEFSALYGRLFPGVRLVTLDRPVADNGADAAWSRSWAHAERHYNANLNTEVIGPAWGDPPLGTFDWIVCTEVIEHLVLHPVELLAPLVSLLAPGGKLYLTTPNFFRRENLERIARRENPQAVYPRRGENWDAHHHFREAAMGELHAFVAEAGGRVATSYYSRCWDGAVPDLPAEQRSNLVLVVERA